MVIADYDVAAQDMLECLSSGGLDRHGGRCGEIPGAGENDWPVPERACARQLRMTQHPHS